MGDGSSQLQITTIHDYSGENHLMAQAMARSSVQPAKTSKKKAPFLVDLYSSAVGKKYVMAITGLFLTLFVFGHMVGNLKMYLGTMSGGKYAYHIDEYGAFLRDLGSPILPHMVFLWIFRLLLIGAFALHMHAAYSLTMMNRRARAVNYASKSDYQAANFASRSMRYTGTIVILYLIWHLLDLTNGVGNAKYRHGDVMNNLDSSLSRWPIAIVYVIANVALAVHLFHGLWSFFQSIGWNNPRFNAFKKKFAIGIVTLITLGNVSFPLAIAAGVVKADQTQYKALTPSAESDK
jgi:succinate dehydrogenase / fumarate reductase, cytochrome b subunit